MKKAFCGLIFVLFAVLAGKVVLVQVAGNAMQANLGTMALENASVESLGGASFLTGKCVEDPNVDNWIEQKEVLLPTERIGTLVVFDSKEEYFKLAEQQ